MQKKMNEKADWKTSETARYDRVDTLETSKGRGLLLGNKVCCFEINIAILIVIDGIDTGKRANIQTKELRDYESARQWVESFLR